MDMLQNFNQILDNLNKKFNLGLAFNEEGHCSFPIDAEVLVSMDYLPESQAILLWSSLGQLPQDTYSLKRAKYLLRYQDMGIDSRGFSIGLDPDDRRAVIHDIRSLAELTTEDKLTSWFDDLVINVKKIREDMATMFPYDNDAEELPELHS